MDKNNKMIVFMSVVLLLSVYAVSRCFSTYSPDKEYSKKQESESTKLTDKISIVLDAGHGGMDPGKVGVNGELEKDINLSIVLKLKEAIEKDEKLNAVVTLTRTDDTGHYKESDSNKKMADMRKRCEIIEEINPEMVISIHQNSYHSSSVKGAQVFYYKESKSGRFLAEKIQASLVEELSEGNKGRVEKANDNYYLIMNVSCPAVIVECGFLSNEEEAKLLSNSQYQDRIVEAIIEGIKEYLGNN